MTCDLKRNQTDKHKLHEISGKCEAEAQPMFHKITELLRLWTKGWVKLLHFDESTVQFVKFKQKSWRLKQL